MPISRSRGRQPQRRQMRLARRKCSLHSTGTSAVSRNTTAKRGNHPVEAAVPAANPNHRQATRIRPAWARQARLAPQRGGTAAFTLAELVVTVGVLVLLVVLGTQLLKSAA